MVPDCLRRSAFSLSRVLFSRHHVTVLQLTPTLFYGFYGSGKGGGEEEGEGEGEGGVVRRRLLGAGSRVRVLAFGGEDCPNMQSLSRWKATEVVCL